MSNPTPSIHVCIFCGRDSNEVRFNREHVIPQSIRGTFYLDGAVCTKCNSELGTAVDAEVLKMPEILDAFAALNYDHDRDGIIRRHYDISGESGGVRLKYGKLTNGHIEFPEQRLTDDSLITPEDNTFDSIQKTVFRDPRLKDAGLSDDEIREGLDELRTKYEEANVGDKIAYPQLGLTIVKRSDQLSIDITSKTGANVAPLICKVAVETIYFFLGRGIFAPENADLIHRLLDSINRREIQRGIHVLRVEAAIKKYSPVHLIRLELHQHICIVRVAFFGHIEFALTGPALSSESRLRLQDQLKMPELLSLDFQQELDTGQKTIWATLRSDEPECIAVL